MAMYGSYYSRCGDERIATREDHSRTLRHPWRADATSSGEQIYRPCANSYWRDAHRYRDDNGHTMMEFSEKSEKERG